jgi:biopolymer transport protein ExbD
MARKSRKIQEINGGPMADIAFLLLIFFLVTTTIDTDSGITRRLPPMPEGEIQDVRVQERNVLTVLVNRNDDLLVNGKRMDIRNLRAEAKKFIENKYNNDKLPQKTKLSKKKADAIASNEEKKAEKIQKAIDMLGDIQISKAIISLQNDRATSYKQYIYVQNELTAAYNELMDELALRKFKSKFKDCTEDQQEAIQTVIPMAISEAEPVEIQ